MNEDVILPKGYAPEPEPEPVDDEFGGGIPVTGPAPEDPEPENPEPRNIVSFRGLADSGDDEREQGLQFIAQANADMVDPSEVYGADRWQSMVIGDLYGGMAAQAQFAEDWTLGMTPSQRAAAVAKVSFDEHMGALVNEFAGLAASTKDVGDPLEFARQVAVSRYARRRTYG